tara:strand:+ start:1213 stop:1530 length:318 start_codon:yes stop_codon:yes gene_type:complete
MASGILGQSAPSATTNTTVYTVPAATTSVVNVNVLNRGTSAATVRIALAAASSPTDGEYIEYDAIVPPKGVLERTGIALNAGKLVVVYASSGDTSVNVYGLETAV